MGKFIPTEPMSGDGAFGEEKVWEGLKRSFYPTFHTERLNPKK